MKGNMIVALLVATIIMLAEAAVEGVDWGFGFGWAWVARIGFAVLFFTAVMTARWWRV